MEFRACSYHFKWALRSAVVGSRKAAIDRIFKSSPKKNRSMPAVSVSIPSENQKANTCTLACRCVHHALLCRDYSLGELSRATLLGAKAPLTCYAVLLILNFQGHFSGARPRQHSEFGHRPSGISSFKSVSFAAAQSLMVLWNACQNRTGH
jgi:hypothetical protein